MSTIVSTGYKLAQTIISNGLTTGNQWSNPNNALLPDGDLAVSNVMQGAASDFILGNFNFNLPQDAVVTGIEIQLIAQRGEQTIPPISLTLVAVDDTSGQNVYYPYTAPFTGLTTALATYILGGQNYQFATQFTVDQLNNLKLQLIANGDISVDCVLLNAYYYTESVTPPTPTESGCIDCNSPIQNNAMALELPFLVNDTKFYIKKGAFTYPDGTPISPGDMGTCGGEMVFVFDPAKNKGQSSTFTENVVAPYFPGDPINSASWTLLPSGVMEIDIKSVTNRGRQFHTPYDHDPSLMSDHDANSTVILSNSGLFLKRFVRDCQVDIVFSPPIVVKDEGVVETPSVHEFDYVGAGVTIQIPDPSQPHNTRVVIPGAGGTTPPEVVGVGSGTSGNTQVLTLSYTVPSAGVDRGAVIQISTQEDVSVVSVDVGGTAAMQLVTETHAGTNIRQEQWGCVAQPIGTLTVTVTLSAPAYISSGCETLKDVDQATPFGAISNTTAASNSPSTILVTTKDYSLVIDGLATAQTPILYTPGPGQTLNWSHTANSDTRQGGSTVEPAGTQPDNVTMSYSLTQNTRWCLTAVEVQGITAPTPPSAGVQSVTGYYVDNTDPANPIITAPKNNTTNSAPTVNDDSTQGYSIDSKWFDTLTNTLYNCVDASVGAAVWAAASTGGGGGGQLITLTAGEDLVTGDTVGYATNIDDSAMKAVWAYRSQTQATASDYESVLSACEIDTNKYILLLFNSSTSVASPVVAQLNDDMTWTFGTPVNLVNPDGQGTAVCKLDTDKFLVALFTQQTPYRVRTYVCTVAGTVITVGGNNTHNSAFNGNFVQLVQLGTDQAAMIVSGTQVSSRCHIFEVTVAGTVPTIGTATLVVNNNVAGMIEKVDTNKIAILFNDTLRTATVAAGVWTINAPVTLPSTAKMGTKTNGGIKSISANNVWVSAVTAGLVVYCFNYDVSGAPALVASGSVNIGAGSLFQTLATDGTEMYLAIQSTDLLYSGFAKLTINGGSIDIGAFAGNFNLGGSYGTSNPNGFVQNNILTMTSFGRYCFFKYQQTSSGTAITVTYHVQGMTPYFVGIAQQTVNLGDPVSVLINGVDTNQSGLSAGTLYDPFEGGLTPTITPTAFTMKAQSSTDVELN